VQRGVIHQDPEFDSSIGANVALIFPFAPTSEHILSSPGGTLRSQIDYDYEAVEAVNDNPWLEGYESMEYESDTGSEYFAKPSELRDTSDYEGLEGIYRFLEECDNARRL
jgi:hypothetical protein